MQRNPISLILFACWAMSPAAALIVAVRTFSISCVVWIPLTAAAVWWVLDLSVRNLAVTDTRDAIGALETLRNNFDLIEQPVTRYIDEVTARNVKGEGTLSGTRFRIITPVPKFPSAKPIGTFKAYLNPGADSLIILRNRARRPGSLDIFYVYHEVGHTTTGGIVHAGSQSFAALRLALMILPCVLLVGPLYAKFVVLLVFFAEWLFESFSATPELAADFYAVCRFFQLKGPEATVSLLRVLKENFMLAVSDPAESHAEQRIEFKARVNAIELYQKAILAGKTEEFSGDPEQKDPFSGSRGIAMFFFRLMVLAIVCAVPRIPKLGETICFAFVVLSVSIKTALILDKDKKLRQVLSNYLFKYVRQSD